MKLFTDGDTFGFETERSDREIATAVADTVDNVSTIMDAVGASGHGECVECGNERDLRPLATAGEDGTPMAVEVCASCQAALVDERIAQAEAKDDA